MSNVPRPRVTRSELVSVLGLSAAFALLLLTWALVTPPLHGPDELAYVDASMHLALGEAWPAAGSMHYLQGLLAQAVPMLPQIAPERVAFGALVGDHAVNTLVNPMSQHPPTYFLAQSLVARALDFTTRRWDIVVLGMRLVDVALTSVLPALVWASVRRATRAPRLAVLAAGALLLVPQLAQFGSSVNAWVPVVTAGAVATWLGMRILTGDRSWWTVLALGGSLAVGTAVMSGGFIAVPFAIAVVLGSRSDLRWGARALRVLVVLAVPALTTGWWWLARLFDTGTLQPDALPTGTERWAVDEGPDPTAFTGAVWNGLSESFWGRLGRYEWPLSPVLVDSLTVVALAALVWAASRRTTDRRVMAVAGVFPVTAIVVVLVRDWATYVGHTGVTVTQGRFLFPALAALLVMQAVAWRGLVVDERVRRRLGRALIVVGPLVAVAALALLYGASYEALQFRVRANGVGFLSNTTPYGLRAIAASVGALVVVGAVTGVVAWRWLGVARRTDVPAPTSPLDSLPTVTSNRRNDP
jgi:4-amino-4-deoxy-L-arabinose transferase-like glycosyltransferase